MTIELSASAGFPFSAGAATGRTRNVRRGGVLLIVLFLFLGGGSGRANLPETAPEPDGQEARPTKTVVDLQPFRHSTSLRIDLPDGPPADATLIDLNPRIGRWYLLQIGRKGDAAPAEYHLENPFPARQRLTLDKMAPDGLTLLRAGEALRCPLWKPFGHSALDAARHSRQVFAPLCNGTVYLRNPVSGHRTAIETVTDFLRDKLPGGDAVVGFVRDTFFKDAYREEARSTTGSGAPAALQPPGFPAPATIDPIYADRPVVPADLGIQTETVTAGLLLGRWYAVKEMPGVFLSLMQPRAVAPEILNSDLRYVNRLDDVEANALAYLVAFDLGRFEIGYAVGTEHPRVDWSERSLPQMKIPDLPGPDGIGSIAPLVPNGMVNPDDAARTVATFTSGFKRIHGAFKYGDLAYRNHGSHYGFLESGVVLSTLQPGLATLLVLADGTLEMKTWTEPDNHALGQIVHARQNGVPLVEFDPDRQKPVPGRLVNRWLPGNWAGSSDKKLRTLRAGAALQQTDGHRFLIYGYFSTATPSAMARVFQAYGVRYAMHLDMNALEHTYLALYRQADGHLLVQHLIQGMSVLDKTGKGLYVPRFLGYPDNRDFFYVMRRGRPSPP
ncbi:MAG: hypothetical protein KQI81_21205 [Deltaproteobacteria bacterium]|nr:hypothetical protein [Deltaproteobacteria bacterium]